MPIGHHVHIRGQVESMEVVRSYTPVLNSLEPMIIDDGTLNLLIKTYNDGALTPVIKNTEIGNKHSKK